MFNLGTSTKERIKNLREIRNQIAHSLSTKLENDKIFDETKVVINKLCRKLPKDVKQRIANSIVRLEQIGPTCCVSHLNIIRLHDEQLMLKVMDLHKEGKEMKLKDLEEQSIKEILKDALEKDACRCVSTEDVHTFVDEKRGYSTEFETISKYLKDIFGISYLENDSKFHEIGWKEHIKTFNDGKVDVKAPPDEPLTNMEAERFAPYLALKVADVRRDAHAPILTVVLDESISSTYFANRSQEDLQSLFLPALEKCGIKYGQGIRDVLRSVQDTIHERQLHKHIGLGNACILREFGKAAYSISYPRCEVSTTTSGDQLHPVHQFVHPNKQKEYNKSFFAKNVVKFVAACMNARQNGTIHFGIMSKENGNGNIVGVPDDIFQMEALAREINRAIRNCFPGIHHQMADRCIGPLHKIGVGNKDIVVEVDIDPSFITDELFTINFPPNGNQTEKTFFYVSKISTLETVSKTKLDTTMEDCNLLYVQRKKLEALKLNRTSQVQSRLREMIRCITAGNQYVTDSLCPLIVCGNYTDCHNRDDILKNLSKMKTAFTSSLVVFDFDESPELVNTIERENTYFEVVLAEDVTRFSDETSFAFMSSRNIWLYCNGNREKGTNKMTLREYHAKRAGGVTGVLENVHKELHDGILILFLLFGKLLKKDPLYLFARDCILKYSEVTVIIADDDEIVSELKTEVNDLIENELSENIFYTGFSWNELSDSIVTVFKHDPETVCKLPLSNGARVSMSRKEKNDCQFSTIDIVSGDECNDKFKEMNGDNARQDKRKKEKENFFKGNEVSWWNFFFPNQVCERDVFTKHVQDIEDKIDKGKELFETVKVLHQPGAGGSTLGRHLIWHFSQLEHPSKNTYRCCVLNQIVKDQTVNQIARFRRFKEKEPAEANPVIVLVDNKNDDSMKTLKDDLAEEAYRKGSSCGKPFCVLIVVSRLSITRNDPRKLILKHMLSQKEISWFEERYNEEMKSFGDQYVKSLISFNVMKENFNEAYIEATTEGIMEGLTEKEEKLLQHLSVINYFDLYKSPVPPSVFDELMSNNVSTYRHFSIHELIESNKAVGIAPYIHAGTGKVRQTWNVTATESCKLLIKSKQFESEHSDLSKVKENENKAYVTKAFLYQNGVLIVSPMIALAILKKIQSKKDCLIASLADELLDFMERQKQIGGVATEYFVQVVSSLFKTRQTRILDDGREEKAKFSNLVKTISSDQEGSSPKIVVQLLRRCIDISSDAFVGQQLARFYIVHSDYESAIEVIQKSVDLVHTNPFLYDTYGHIYKSKVKYMLTTTSGELGEKASTEILESTLKAMEYFKKAQVKDVDSDVNSFYQSEVETALYTMEKIRKFACCKDKSLSLQFLNGVDTNAFDALQPQIECFRKGNVVQTRIDVCLRHLEDKRCMVKRKHHETTSLDDDRYSRDLRARYQGIYRNDIGSYTDMCPVGETFQSVKDVFSKSNDQLQKHIVKLGKQIDNREYGIKDLLTFIGFNVITMTQGGAEDATRKYKQMLTLTDNLINMQQVDTQRRPYIEAYLYHVIFHWPLSTRLEMFGRELCDVERLDKLIKHWQRAYDDQFKRRPTMFFALGNGTPGQDIVDQDIVKVEWRQRKKKEGRERLEVKQDDIWNDPNFKELYIRLEGTVDGIGKYVEYAVQFDATPLERRGPHTMKIQAYKYCDELLRNRRVTFIVGFTWEGPRAIDIKQVKDKAPIDEVEVFDEQEELEHEVMPSARASGKRRNRGNANQEENVSAAADTGARPKVQTRDNFERKVVRDEHLTKSGKKKSKKKTGRNQGDRRQHESILGKVANIGPNLFPNAAGWYKSLGQQESTADIEPVPVVKDVDMDEMD